MCGEQAVWKRLWKQLCEAHNNAEVANERIGFSELSENRLLEGCVHIGGQDDRMRCTHHAHTHTHTHAHTQT